MNSALLTEGLIAMGIGMGVVLSFLVVMIFSMIIMSKVVGYLNKIFPEAVPAPAKSKKSAVKEEEQIAVAIAAIMARQA